MCFFIEASSVSLKERLFEIDCFILSVLPVERLPVEAKCRRSRCI